MDDIGLQLAERDSGPAAGRRPPAGHGMPKVLAVLSVVGTAAMLWVGGHILLVGARRARLARAVRPGARPRGGRPRRRRALGGVLAWLVNTLASAVVGLVVGAVVVAVMHLMPRREKAAAKH